MDLPPRHRLSTGFANHFTIERELGRGAMATVYLGRDRKHGREVAIKVLRPEVAAAIGADRFLREIRLLARLQHPHILPLYDSGDLDGDLYYVMPLVEGESLRERLDRDGRLPLADALAIARDVAEALAFAHSRDVVHRDVKPENIMLQTGHALVADFGIARAITRSGRASGAAGSDGGRASDAGGERTTDGGFVVGTPAYMSPEQASGDPGLDGRTDIYALGCVLYEMLAGAPPFTGGTAQSLIAQRFVERPRPIRSARWDVPAAVDAAVARALAPAPGDRFATAAELAETLGALALIRPTLPRWRRWLQRWTRTPGSA